MIDALDRRILYALQDGLPLSAAPYRDAAEALGIEQDELLSRLRALSSSGIIRRMAASLAHVKLGIRANAMVVWQVPETEVERIGRLVTGFDEVTHCYERPPLPEWPYNLYAMIHGRSEPECEAVVQRIEQATGLSGAVLAYSRHEFKKTWTRIV